MTMSDNEWYNKWKRMTVADNEWQRVTANDNEEQRMTASGATNENNLGMISTINTIWWIEFTCISSFALLNSFLKTKSINQ